MGCNQSSLHPKVELFSFNGNLQRVDDEREVESPGSLDSRIRKGNLRYIITYSSAATAECIVEDEVQRMLFAGCGLGMSTRRASIRNTVRASPMGNAILKSQMKKMAF
ncbi:hypothetical protein NC651_007866 [Populus alba x Populus x berolinensis]|nr:hypothetical protein NC651_007866 [Populus alba x Populus x berolinensis]